MTPRHFLIPLMFLLTACDPGMVYDQYVSTGDGKWNWNEVELFEVEMEDTLSLYNIYIQVRHTVDYPMSNLYMFVGVKGPSGQFIKDTINLILAAPDGSWTGRGLGKLRELRLLYKKDTRFGESGTYTFTLEQAMRKSELPVTDVGVRIEHINP